MTSFSGKWMWCRRMVPRPPVFCNQKDSFHRTIIIILDLICALKSFKHILEEWVILVL